MIKARHGKLSQCPKMKISVFDNDLIGHSTIHNSNLIKQNNELIKHRDAH